MAKKSAIYSSTEYWLFKSEPDAFSWDMLVAKGEKGEPWTGVRNYLARNNMRLMKIGDRGLFITLTKARRSSASAKSLPSPIPT